MDPAHNWNFWGKDLMFRHEKNIKNHKFWPFTSSEGSGFHMFSPSCGRCLWNGSRCHFGGIPWIGRSTQRSLRRILWWSCKKSCEAWVNHRDPHRDDEWMDGWMNELIMNKDPSHKSWWISSTCIIHWFMSDELWWWPVTSGCMIWNCDEWQ
jgi:hypothetical protein